MRNLRLTQLDGHEDGAMFASTQGKCPCPIQKKVEHLEASPCFQRGMRGIFTVIKLHIDQGTFGGP